MSVRPAVNETRTIFSHVQRRWEWLKPIERQLLSLSIDETRFTFLGCGRRLGLQWAAVMTVGTKHNGRAVSMGNIAYGEEATKVNASRLNPSKANSTCLYP